MAAGFRVLLVDVHWLDAGGDVVGPGYLVVEGGRVAGMGPGEPGEEEQYAEMVAGGVGRLVVPGFAGFLAPELYVFRGRVGSDEMLDVLGFSGYPPAEALEPLDTYYATLMAAWEAMLNAVTRLIVLSRYPAYAAKALSEAGLTGVVLVPGKNCSGLLEPRNLGGEVEEARRLGVDLARVSLVELSCARSVEPGAGWRLGESGLYPPDQDKPVVALGEAGGEYWLPVTSPWPLLYSSRGKLWHRLVADLHRVVDRGYEPFQGAAHIAVLDLSEPPGWVPPEAACPACLGPGRPRVETVFSGGRMVVDGYEPLYVGSAAAEEAARRLGRKLVLHGEG